MQYLANIDRCRFYIIFCLGPSLFIRKEGELTDATTYCAVVRQGV